MRRLTPLGWQEAVADAVVWLTDGAAVRRPGEVCQGTPYAAAVLTLRTGEYASLDPAARVSLLRLLCDRAAAMNLVREALERREQWRDAMGWEWEAAAALGRAQALAPSGLLAEPLGRDRTGRVYYLLQGTLWAAGPKETKCWTSLDDMHTVSGLFEKSRGNTEKRLHYALSTTLADGTVASHQRKFAFERGDDNDAPAPSELALLPTRRGGRRGRRSWRRTWRRTRT